MSVPEMEMWIEHANTYNGLMIFTFHSLGANDPWFDQISETFYHELLDVVVDKQSSTWVTTFAKAIKYHKEAHCATLATIANTSNQWTQSNPAENSGLYQAWTNLGECSAPFREFTQEEISIYPNPFTTQFSVEASVELIGIDVYNIAGQLVQTNEGDTNIINLYKQASGVYIIHISSVSKYAKFRIIKL